MSYFYQFRNVRFLLLLICFIMSFQEGFKFLMNVKSAQVHLLNNMTFDLICIYGNELLYSFC